MPSVELWQAATSRGNVLTTELNSLADAASTVVSSAIDNSVNLDIFAVAVLSVTYGSAPNLDSICSLFAVCAPDGTNYENGSNSVRYPEDSFVGVFQLFNVTSAQILVTKPFELRPFKTKFALKNSAGQSMAASGNTVALFTFNRTIG
jgi:hypothetical protein